METVVEGHARRATTPVQDDEVEEDGEVDPNDLRMLQAFFDNCAVESVDRFAKWWFHKCC